MKKLLLILLAVPLIAFAWEPTKPVTVIVGLQPGSGNEIAFRQLAAIVNKSNPKANFVVQNMPGADSVIAMNHMLTVPADGYTAAIPSHMSMYVTNDVWEKNVKKFAYDEFSDVLTMGKSPLVLVASSVSVINTPQEFVKRIQTTDKPINIAVGGGAHRTAYEFLANKGKANYQVKAIKFNGPAPTVASVAQFSVAGGTEFGIVPILVAKPLIDAGKIKAIGFTGTQRMPQFPNVPLLNTVAPGINVYAAWSLVLPPNTPKEIVDWYTKTFSDAIRTQEYKDWCESNIIFVEEKELTPEGVRKHAKELRASFLPVLNSVDFSKD